MRGQLFAWAGKNLLALSFDDRNELTELLKDIGDGKRLKEFAVGYLTLEDTVMAEQAKKLAELTQPLGDKPPNCPKHGPMMKSKNGVGWYCSKKEMGEWCGCKVDGNGVVTPPKKH